MADFQLTTPDGVTYRVTAPDEQSAVAALKKMLGSAPAEPERGLLGDIGAFLTGADRDPAIGGPLSLDLPMTNKQAAQMTALMATTMSPERLKSGLQRIEPDVTFREDEYGTLIAQWPRKNERGEVTGYMPFYPNPKGLDMTDAMRVSGAVSAATPVAKGLQALGLATRGLLGGATVGATEAALVEGASSQLSGAPYQLSDIPMGAVGGAGGELLGRTIQGLIGLARTRGPQAVVDQMGNLLPEYADIVRKAGLDPAQVSAAVAADIASMVASGARGDQAATAAMARNLPVPIPMTRGAITGDVGQQLFEDMASKGVYGDAASTMMRGQRANTQDALRANLDALMEQLNPGGAPISRGEGGAAAQAALATKRAEQGTMADEMYKLARKSTAVVSPDAAIDVADAMRAAYREGFDPLVAPVTAQMIDKFDTIVASGDVRRMMEWRQQLSGLRKGAPTPDGEAAKDVINAFDANTGAMIDRALLSGDADAVAVWGMAIRNYADYAAKWKSKGGILNLLTEEVGRDGQRVLRVADTAAADTIFSATASGLATKTGLPRDLITLRLNLPDEQWNQLRQEAFIRLMDAAEGGYRSGGSEVSGVGFKKAWEKLKDRNPGVVNGLFSKDEQKLLQQFADVAAKATNVATNTSNSAAAAGGIIQRLAGSLGSTGLAQFLLRVPVARGLTEAYGGARAVAATRGVTPTPRTPLTIGGAGLGAAAASSEQGKTMAEDRIRSFTGIPR
jgi:hypothetical protein